MKYRLQALDDDGLVTSDTEIDALHIPKGGDLVVRIPNVWRWPAADIHALQAGIEEFFKGRRILIVPGETTFLRIVEEPPVKLIINDAPRAQCTCTPKHDPHCPGGIEYWQNLKYVNEKGPPE